MSWDDPEEPEAGVVVRRQFRAVHPPGAPEPVELKPGLIRRFLAWVHAMSAEDFGRLKRAGVEAAEGEARMRNSEAVKREAEAAAQFAEAEVKLQEAEAKRILNERLRQADATERAQAEAEAAERIAAATERLAAAISRIRQQGGTVGFDSAQLERLLGAHDPDEVRARPSGTAEGGA